MTDLSPSQASPAVHERTIPSNPNFFRTWRGVWLLTWKSQVTWRRLSLGLLSLLPLPLLIYLTTSSPRDWAESHRPKLGDPAAYLSSFSRRLARANLPLRPEQSAGLLRIFTEEFRRAEAEGVVEAQSPEAVAEALRQQIESCRERIRQRAQNVLDEDQFAQFRSFQKRNRNDRPAPVVGLAWNRTAPFYHWLIDVYFFIVVPLQCVRMCGPLIRDELEADTLSFLTIRPLTRARLLLLKFFSQAAWLQIGLFVQALFLFAVASFRQIPALDALIPLFLGAQFLAVFAWSALGVFLGQVSKRYMALALLYGTIVEMGIGRIPTNINTLSLMRHLKTLLGHDPALQGIYHWPALGVGAPVGALVLGTAVFLALAALLFTFKEYQRTTEMHK